MMNFEEFKAWVKENITSKDWKETSQIEISVVKKNNGVSATGLFIRESGQDVSPILYLDDYYIKDIINGLKKYTGNTQIN